MSESLELGDEAAVVLDSETTAASAHLVYVISGNLTVAMDDGTEGEMGAGDVARIEPGHDAWVSGDEACIVVDFAGDERYTKRA